MSLTKFLEQFMKDVAANNGKLPEKYKRIGERETKDVPEAGKDLHEHIINETVKRALYGNNS